MALTTCNSCGKEVSPKAASCPHCGQPKPAKRKPSAKRVLIGLGIAIVAVILLSNLGGKSDKSANTGSGSKQTASAPPTREKQIKDQFSPWDGSHRNLERLIKKSMNDPDSYDHDKTVYWDKGDFLIVKTTFRGKNAYGGVVKNWVKAKVDMNGNVLQVIAQGP